MSARSETLLWLAQRITAAILAIAVVVHIATIVMAMDGGLSAREIISRVQGNVAWLIFYLIFVIAVAVHAPIGLRTVMREVTSLSLPIINTVVIFVSLFLCVAGSRAIFGLYGVAG
ncbi:MAG: hypothetical protein ACKVHL_05320 [Rhodospirillales bacterium]|jgi:fumarate reductase subunit C